MSSPYSIGEFSSAKISGVLERLSSWEKTRKRFMSEKSLESFISVTHSQENGKRPSGDGKSDGKRSDVKEEEFQLFTDVVLGTAHKCLKKFQSSHSLIFHIPKQLFYQLWLSNREKDALIRDLNMRIGCLYLQLRQKGGENRKFSTDLMIVSRFFKRHGYTLDTIVKSKQKIFSLMGSVNALKAKLLRIQKLLSEKTQEVKIYKRLAEENFTESKKINCENDVNELPVSEKVSKCSLASTGKDITFDKERIVEGAECMPVATIQKDGKEILVAVASNIPQEIEDNFSVNSCTRRNDAESTSDMEACQEDLQVSQCDKTEVKDLTSECTLKSNSQSEVAPDSLKSVKIERLNQPEGKDLILKRFDFVQLERGKIMKYLEPSKRSAVKDISWDESKYNKEDLKMCGRLTDMRFHNSTPICFKVGTCKRFALEDSYGVKAKQLSHDLQQTQMNRLRYLPENNANQEGLNFPGSHTDSSMCLGFVGSISSKIGHPVDSCQVF